MKVSKTILRCMLFILFWAGFIQAQSSGRIRGKIMDKETGEVWVGTL